MSNDTEYHIDRWCITPFSTRTKILNLNEASQRFFIELNVFILIADVTFSLVGMYFLKSTTLFKRKYCLWLLYNIFINDIIFTVLTQTSYAVKLFIPELPCIYDIVWSCLSLTTANTSLALVFAVAALRLFSTENSLQMKSVLSKSKSRWISFLAYLFGLLISILMTAGSIFNNVYLIHLPAALTDLLFPIVVSFIYQRAAQICRRRRETAYFKTQKSLAETTLRRGMFGTLITYLPFRVPYFISSTYKMIYIVQDNHDSNFDLQFVHSLCFLIFCATPIGNVVLYFASDRRPRRRMIAYFAYYKGVVLKRVRRVVHRSIEQSDI